MDEDGETPLGSEPIPQFMHNTLPKFAVISALSLCRMPHSFSAIIRTHEGSLSGILYIGEIGGWGIPPRAGTLQGGASYLDLTGRRRDTLYSEHDRLRLSELGDKPWLQGI